MTNYGCTNLAAMSDGFPSKPDTIQGKPNLKILLHPCLRHLCSCAMSHCTHRYPLGKLYLTICAPSYALHTQHPYPERRVDPRKTPHYNPNDNATAQKIIKNQFAVNYKLHHDKNTLNMALIEHLYALLDPKYA